MRPHGRFPQITVLGVLASGLALLLSASLSNAQGQSPAAQYIVVRLGSLGGTVGRSNSVNDRGWVSGWWNLPGDINHHAVLWIDGQANDLGTLGGPSSEIEFIATNEFGMLAGGSDTAKIDPYGENFCIINDTSNTGFPDQFECSAFRWENGVMSALPGLGGNSSYATNSNRSGHTVGWAETALDPNCLAPQVFDIHGALWSGDSVRNLPPLPGDAVSAAFAIDDYDVAAGGSGYCGSPGDLGFALLTHAVIWRNGLPIDLGGLGGQFNNTATDSNNRGQVVGMSDPPGDTVTHAVLWQNEAINDLGTLPGDAFSYAWAISEDGKMILGQSCDTNGNCRGFLWQNGVMTDVNTLITAESQLIVIDANDTNAAGDITGQAFDPVTGEMPAIELIPCSHANSTECNSTARASVHITLPQNVRDALKAKRRRFKK
jgi:probable HAF family extracellular repeat protein